MLPIANYDDEDTLFDRVQHLSGFRFAVVGPYWLFGDPLSAAARKGGGQMLRIRLEELQQYDRTEYP